MPQATAYFPLTSRNLTSAFPVGEWSGMDVAGSFTQEALLMEQQLLAQQVCVQIST